MDVAVRWPERFTEARAADITSRFRPPELGSNGSGPA